MFKYNKILNAQMSWCAWYMSLVPPPPPAAGPTVPPTPPPVVGGGPSPSHPSHTPRACPGGDRRSAAAWLPGPRRGAGGRCPPLPAGRRGWGAFPLRGASGEPVCWTTPSPLQPVAGACPLRGARVIWRGGWALAPPRQQPPGGGDDGGGTPPPDWRVAPPAAAATGTYGVDKHTEGLLVCQCSFQAHGGAVETQRMHECVVAQTTKKKARRWVVPDTATGDVSQPAVPSIDTNAPPPASPPRAPHRSPPAAAPTWAGTPPTPAARSVAGWPVDIGGAAGPVHDRRHRRVHVEGTLQIGDGVHPGRPARHNGARPDGSVHGGTGGASKGRRDSPDRASATTAGLATRGAATAENG